MQNTENIPDKQFIFATLLMVANKMDTLMERELKGFGVTSKQWFLSMLIDNMFSEPPTIKEVAKKMASSHQNVKQIAVKLQEKKLVNLKKDINDARVTRIEMSETSHEFWKQTQPTGEVFMKEMFSGIEDEKLEVFREVMERIFDNLEDMEDKKL